MALDGSAATISRMAAGSSAQEGSRPKVIAPSATPITIAAANGQPRVLSVKLIKLKASR